MMQIERYLYVECAGMHVFISLRTEASKLSLNVQCENIEHCSVGKHQMRTKCCTVIIEFKQLRQRDTPTAVMVVSRGWWNVKFQVWLRCL